MAFRAKDQRGNSEGLTPATQVTVEQMPNSYGPEETMTVIIGSTDQPILAFAMEGDGFPRVVILNDSTDALFYLGDGTYDPLSGDPYVAIGYLSSEIGGASLPRLQSYADVEFVETRGPILNGASHQRLVLISGDRLALENLDDPDADPVAVEIATSFGPGTLGITPDPNRDVDGAPFNQFQFSFGDYSILINESTILLSNGVSTITLDSDGASTNGDILWENDVSGPVLRSPDNTPWRLKVDDAGVLSAEEIV